MFEWILSTPSIPLSFSGKPLKMSLPLVRITKDHSETPAVNPEFVEQTTFPVPTKPARIPRNAGTAAILAKMKQQEKKERVESPPPEIIAEVVVF